MTTYRVWIDQDLCTGDGLCQRQINDLDEFIVIERLLARRQFRRQVNVKPFAAKTRRAVKIRQQLHLPRTPADFLLDLTRGAFFCTSSRAASAAAKVCAKLLPGGSDSVTCVCDKSSGGMKPVGSSGTSASEPAMKAPAASVVHRRCFRHHAAQPM